VNNIDTASKQRKIIHIDMDAFFASIEQRDFPELRGKPVAVGSPDRRGVIAAASYEARKYGVRSAMPSSIAKQKCPHLIFVKHRFDVYKQVSGQIREIFHRYTDLVEPLSIDEAYLDVTSNKPGISLATDIAKAIRADIFKETGLTASAGISYNKFLAKTASDIKKPNGQKLIHPVYADDFIAALPVSKFFGVGKATEIKMNKAGIYFGKDLKNFSAEALTHLFGKQGEYFYRISHGIDNREVKSSRQRKSVGAERTFSEDLTGASEMFVVLEKIADEVSKRAQHGNHRGRTITLKFKYFDFEQHTRSKTIDDYINDNETILNEAFKLLSTPEYPGKPVRLLGITLNNLGEKKQIPMQLTMGF
jgi:DNA polymerase-4